MLNEEGSSSYQDRSVRFKVAALEFQIKFANVNVLSIYYSVAH